MHEHLLVMPYAGVSPEFASPPLHAGPGAAVLGRVTAGRRAWIGASAVVRADGHYVAIGEDFRLGARGTVHIAHDAYPTRIGSGVTAGVNSIIHACDIGDNCYIGCDVVILNGSTAGDGAALADGAIVFPRSSLEGGWLYAGQPAKPVRRLEPGELDALHAASRSQPDEPAAEPSRPLLEAAGPLFIAATARLDGRVLAGPNVGVWFGCDLDAGSHAIVIGENTNVQDNTIIRCEQRSSQIGRDTTIGHNVLMTDCLVGDRSLIGMGATVAAGTVVEDDVLFAAGARTLNCQKLESGWLYGGSPARQLSRLDDDRRSMITRTSSNYRSYARKFDSVQRER